MGVLHETEKNFIRSGVVALNHLNALGLSDAKVGAVTPSTIAGLETIISALNVHETEKNMTRQFGGAASSSDATQKPRCVLQKLSDLRTPIAKPVAPSGSNLTTSTAGGTLLDSTAYYYTVTAIDKDGVESIGSAEVTKTTGGPVANTSKITLKNMVAIDGAASYRIYRGTTTGVYSGYLADASKTIESSGGFSDTGAALTGTASPPTTNTATVGALSDTDIAVAVAAATFSSLRDQVTEEDTVNFATDFQKALDRGGQVGS